MKILKNISPFYCLFQERALKLVTVNSPSLRLKIKELNSAMYKALGEQPSVNPYSENFTANGGGGGGGRVTRFGELYHHKISYKFHQIKTQ